MQHPSRNGDPRAEVLARGFSSFEAFCGLLDIVPKGKPRQKFVLNPIQRAYCGARTARDVILKSRQVGFTTLEQARDVWHFLTHPGARVTMMVQSISDADSPARKAKRVFDMMFESLAQLGYPLAFGKSPSGVWTLPDRDSVLRIVEAGASLKAAQKKGRGDTVTRLHVTEEAFWEFADESLLAVENSVVSPEQGGEIVKESTPNGAGGKFYLDCSNARAGYSSYKFHFFPWHMDPGNAIPLQPGEAIAPATDRERQLVAAGVRPDQIKWYRQTVADLGSQDKADQEQPSDPDSCFLLSGRPFFSRDRLEKMRTKWLRARPLETIDVREDGAYGQIRIWKQPQRGARYVLSLDTSEGTGGDRGAGIVRERGTGELCAVLHGQFRDFALARAGAALGKRFHDATIAVERNNHGHAVLLALTREQKYPRIYRDRDDKLGWLTGAVSRTEALSILDSEVRDGRWETKDAEVLSELRTFIVKANGRPEADKGSFDDLVFAEAICLDVIRKPEPPRGYGTTAELGLHG